MNLDLWLKRIWLFIGIVLLLIALIGGSLLLVELFRTGPRTGPLVGPDAKPKGIDSLVAQDISFNVPARVGKTDLYYVGVRVRDLKSQEKASTYQSRGISYQSEFRLPDQNFVNIIFAKRDGSGSYALLDKRAFIRTFDIPSESDSNQSYDLFDISFWDTDHDGRITTNDSSQLYISDKSGENLSQVTKEGDEIVWHQKSTDRRQVFILMKERPPQAGVPADDWPERLYAFDVANRTLSRFPQDGRTVEEIRNTLWGK